MTVAATIIFALPLAAIGISIATATQIVDKTSHQNFGRWMFRLSILVFFWCLAFLFFIIKLPGNTWTARLNLPFGFEWLDLFKVISYLFFSAILVLLGSSFMLGLEPGKSFLAILLWLLSAWLLHSS